MKRAYDREWKPDENDMAAVAYDMTYITLPHNNSKQKQKNSCSI